MSSLKTEVKQAARNLLRNKRRSLVTGLAILSGFIGLALLTGYVARVERYLMVNTVYLGHTGHVEIYKKGGIDKYFSKPAKYLLTPEEVESVKELLKKYDDEFEFKAPYLLSNGLLQVATTSYPFQGKGVDPTADFFTKNHPLVRTWTREISQHEKGTPLSDSALIFNPVKITTKLYNNLGQSSELQLLGLTLDNGFNAMDATVSSTYSTGLDLTEDTSIMSTVKVFQELMGTDGITYLGLYLKKDVKARWLTYKLNEEFRSSSLPFEAIPFFDERVGLFYTGTMNFLYAMAAFFFSLVSLVVILSIANAISMNIIERIRELGSMRAMGYTTRDLSRLIAIESFLLALGSVFVGFLLSQLIALLVNSMNIRFFPPGIAGDMQFIVTPWPSLCLLLAIPLITLSVATAYFVTRTKLRGEVAALLAESTT